MKRFALAAILLAGVSATSQAADIAPAPAMDWTGFYAGAFAGGGWGTTDIGSERREHGEENEPETLQGGNGHKGGGPSLDVDGMLGGVQAGYDLQHDAFLFGIVGDFAFSGISGDVEKAKEEEEPKPAILNGQGNGDGSGPPAAFDVEYDWLATLRARVGFLPTENWLIYGTGGLAWAGINFESTIDEGPLSGMSNDDSDFGYAVGGGTEVRLDESWSLFAEALYMDFGDNDVDVESDEGPYGSVNYDSTLWTVKAGVNFRFN